MMRKARHLISAVLCLCLLLAGCSSSAGTKVETEEETYTLGTGQVVTSVKSLEDTLAEKKIQDRTLRLGAYGENFVTSTLSTVGYNNLIAISTIYDGLFAKNFETGEILCRVAESYEFIPDEEGEGMTLHIVIREGAHF